MEELYDIDNHIDNYNHNPLYNPRMVPTRPPNSQPQNHPQNHPSNHFRPQNHHQSSKTQPNTLQLQFKQYPANHNLKSLTNVFQDSNQAPNHQKQHYKTCTAKLPKGIKKVTFLPKTKPSKPPNTATIEHANSQPKLFRKYSQRTKEQYIPPNNQSIPYNNQQIPQFTPQYNNHPYSHPQLYNQANTPNNHSQFTYNSSECGQQFTSFGIPQQRPHSEPILKHTQTEPNIFQPTDITQRSQTEPVQFTNNNNNNISYSHPQYNKHHKYNKYMPKATDEIRHSTVAHMYTMTAHFEMNILIVEVYDSIQGNRFRNEFVQRDFTMYPIFDVAKILVDGINSTQSNKNTISINGFKPISISEYGKWCYLTVNGTQIPSFALRPTY
eukprot:59790_1